MATVVWMSFCRERNGRRYHAAFRVHTALGLQLCNKAPKRRVKANLNEGRWRTPDRDQTKVMEFLDDQLAMGKKSRALTVVSIFSKLFYIVHPRLDYLVEKVVKSLEMICGYFG